MSRDQDPLAPEERARAPALARATPPAPWPRRRWPAALGVAASLVVAVGIAWQLRPIPEQAHPAASQDTLPPAREPAMQPSAATSPSQAETAIGRGRVRQQTAAPPVLARTLEASTTVAAPRAPPTPEPASDNGGIVFDRQELHDVPPATVDSPGIHRAWLDRIRELREAGEIEAARESLREYQRRYPRQPLPADLDGLLDE